MGMNGNGQTPVDRRLWTEVGGWKGPNGRNRTEICNGNGNAMASVVKQS
jgi:hypothetical protein